MNEDILAQAAGEDRVPTTDEEALRWLAGKSEAAMDLYRLYRRPEAFNMDVKTALYETLKACVPSIAAEMEELL